MLDRLLEDAYASADYLIDQAKRASINDSDDLPLAIFAGSAPALVRRSMSNHHVEQYRHFTGWTYSIVRTIAQRIAGQPFRIARKKTSEKKSLCPGFKSMALKRTLPTHLKNHADNLEVIEDHAFIRALEKPNPISVYWTLMYVTIASLELTGKAYWWFHHDEKEGLQIWHLPSHWVEPIHDQRGLYAEWVVRAEGMAEDVKVPGECICLLAYPDPSNPLNAISPLQSNARAVVADESMQEAQRRSFQNGINPGVALVVGRNPDAAPGVPDSQMLLSKAQREQLRTAVKQIYRGVVNQDEPLILDAFIKDVKRITMGPREMDFLQSGTISKERLTQGWGVNPVSMGQLEGANRASSATADDHFAANVINPKIVLISQMLTVCVRRLFNDDSLVAYLEEAHAVDPDYELALELAMVGNFAMSRNEWRARHHLPPLVEGNSAIVGGMEIVLDREEKEAPEVSIKTVGLRIGVKAQSRLWAKQHRQRERVYASELRNVLVEVGQDIARKIRDDSDKMRALNSYDFSFLLDRIKQVSESNIVETALTGAVTEWELSTPRRRDGEVETDRMPVAWKAAGGLPDEISSAVARYTRDVLKQEYWTDLVTNLRASIAAAIQVGIERGDSGDQVADRVGRLLGNNGASIRSYRIARTETTGALNAGHAATRDRLAALGFIKSKQWLSILDSDTRPDHHKANGQTVDPNENFEVGGEPCDHPGDFTLSAAQRVNCRCHVISISAFED